MNLPYFPAIKLGVMVGSWWRAMEQGGLDEEKDCRWRQRVRAVAKEVLIFYRGSLIRNGTDTPRGRWCVRVWVCVRGLAHSNYTSSFSLWTLWVLCGFHDALCFSAQPCAFPFTLGVRVCECVCVCVGRQGIDGWGCPVDGWVEQPVIHHLENKVGSKLCDGKGKQRGQRKRREEEDRWRWSWRGKERRKGEKRGMIIMKGSREEEWSKDGEKNGGKDKRINERE